MDSGLWLGGGSYEFDEEGLYNILDYLLGSSSTVFRGLDLRG